MHIRVALAALALLGGAGAAFAQGRACAELLALARPDLRLTRAEAIPAGTLPVENRGRASLAGPDRAPMPAHCVVEGMIAPRTGAGGVAFGTGFQLRIPDAWNGRLLTQGGGGMDGVVVEAVGAIPLGGATAAPALMRGHAVVSTDAGHQGRDTRDASFGLDQQARLDYAQDAIPAVTRLARQLVEARHGRAPERSYFMGCSNGGRQGMMAAQRHPLLFDGIVAGNPGFRLSRAAAAQAWDVQAPHRAAPRDAAGNPVLSAALSPDDMRLLATRILAACDAADGLADGLVSAPSQCRFDPAPLRCAGEKAADCLSAPQVAALAQVFGGARDPAGRAVYAGWPWDPGIAGGNWRLWKLGTAPPGQPANALNATLAAASLGFYFSTPPRPDMEVTRFDMDRDVAALAETAAINDATGTMLSSFAARGARMIVFQGLADPVFSATDLADHWRLLAAHNPGLDGFARLFMLPGLTHCGGGPATDDMDPLAALEAWVERGEAPTRILARGRPDSFPGRSRPLCPFPQEAHYTGGNPEDAASFACRAP